MAEENKIEVKNHDIIAFDRRIKGYMFQLSNSQSVDNDKLNPADLTRIKEYVEAAKDYLSWITGQDPLDLPHIHPTIVSLAPDLANNTSIKNKNILDIINHLDILRLEAIRCNSRNSANGIDDADANRLTAIITKLENLISNFVEEHDGLDTPEDEVLAGK